MDTPVPTIGRIVLVPVDPMQNNGSIVAPAVITRVWNPSCVNVRILLDGPETPWRTSLTYVSSVSALPPGPAHVWTWPPRT